MSKQYRNPIVINIRIAHNEIWVIKIQYLFYQIMTLVYNTEE